MPLSSFAETKAPTWVENGNFRRSTRFLECHPVTSPLTNQKKTTHLAALTSNLPIKTVLPKTFKNSCFLSMSCPFSLQGPSINFSLLQTLTFGLFGFTVYQAYEPVLNNLFSSYFPSSHSPMNLLKEKTLESPLDSKEIKPVSLKGNQSWIFLGRTDAEAEASILWPPDTKSWLTRKDRDAGRDWRQEEKGTTEDEMVGWHHRLHRHEFEQSPRVGDGQGSLMCCSPWGHKESDVMSDWTTTMRGFHSHHCTQSCSTHSQKWSPHS